VLKEFESPKTESIQQYLADVSLLLKAAYLLEVAPLKALFGVLIHLPFFCPYDSEESQKKYLEKWGL